MHTSDLHCSIRPVDKSQLHTPTCCRSMKCGLRRSTINKSDSAHSTRSASTFRSRRRKNRHACMIRCRRSTMSKSGSARSILSAYTSLERTLQCRNCLSRASIGCNHSKKTMTRKPPVPLKCSSSSHQTDTETPSRCNCPSGENPAPAQGRVACIEHVSCDRF
jgi:hypothetical protein